MSGDGVYAFTDLCRGGHTADVSVIQSGSWKLDELLVHIGEVMTMLTRVYGLAFESERGT